MSFNRPTLSELISRVQTDIKSKLTTAEAALRHAMLKVLGAVLAAVAHGLYGNLAWLAKQLFPDTAESEYLARYAAARGVSKKGATAATAKATATGTDDQGIGVDTEVQRVDGTRFKVTEYATIIRRYDSRPGTLFYCDPPYWGCTDDYGKNVFSPADFELLRASLEGIQGHFILSINDTPEVRAIFAGFTMEEVALNYRVSGRVTPARELIITGP